MRRTHSWSLRSSMLDFGLGQLQQGSELVTLTQQRYLDAMLQFVLPSLSHYIVVAGYM